MPNYNQTLQTNNSSLEDILTQINNLPEAGGTAEDLDAELTTQEGLIEQLSTILDSKASGGGSGGSEVETCTISVAAYPAGGATYIYTDGSMQLQECEDASTIIVAKNTLILYTIVAHSVYGRTVSGGLEEKGNYAYLVTGDGSITYNNSAEPV